MRIPLNGVRSDGLRMNVLPAAIAMGNVHIGTMSGKLNGVMAAHTPTGYRSIIVSMPRLTDSTLYPAMSDGMPIANSTTSSARRYSPAASE